MSSAFVQLFYGNCSAPTFSDAYLSEGKTKGELTRNQNSLLSPVDKVELQFYRISNIQNTYQFSVYMACTITSMISGYLRPQ